MSLAWVWLLAVVVHKKTMPITCSQYTRTLLYYSTVYIFIYNFQKKIRYTCVPLRQAIFLFPLGLLEVPGPAYMKRMNKSSGHTWHMVDFMWHKNSTSHIAMQSRVLQNSRACMQSGVSLHSTVFIASSVNIMHDGCEWHAYQSSLCVYGLGPSAEHVIMKWHVALRRTAGQKL